MNDIWVIADAPERGLELLAKARELAGSTNGRVICFLAGDEAAGRAAVAGGADAAVLIPIPAEGLWEDHAAPLAERAAEAPPRLVLVSASRRGKDLAAKLAGRLDAECVTDCKRLQMADGRVKVERVLYGGLAVARLEGASFPLVATFGARCFEPLAADPGRTGEVSAWPAPAGQVKVLERRPNQAAGVPLAEADLVVGVGRGFEKEEELGLARTVAQALGAELACSRPIAEFFKWLPENRYLGISGQQIKARLYLACGISGQVQHLFGIRDAKTIVAVNKDPNAPIFDVADYFVVGDLREFLPALAQALAAAGK